MVLKSVANYEGISALQGPLGPFRGLVPEVSEQPWPGVVR